MENDMSVSDVLREMIAFLECLRDAQLPLTLEDLREKLLERSKGILRAAATAPSSSPEPYLDMNAGPKSVLLTKAKSDTEEYVGMEESPKQPHQDYYETFEHDGRAVAAAAIDREPARKADDRDEGQALIYKNLTPAQCRVKCHKCGPLYRKEGKKLFPSKCRACWIALVGTHLLVYRNERQNRPCAIYPLRGYMARPAPGSGGLPQQRDRRKRDESSSFEIYCPGSETLQFVARTPKDMDQWVTKVCEVGRGEGAKNETGTDGGEEKRSESPIKDRRDAAAGGGSTVVDRPTSTGLLKEEPRNGRNAAERRDEAAACPPPPLPARIPRRLPSLPHEEESVPVYKAAVEDNDEDDNIYDRIEDLKNGKPYQNMMPLRKQRATVDDERKKREIVAYDEERESDRGRGEKKSAIPDEETYDDIAVALSRSNAVEEEDRNGDWSVVDGNEGEEESYDDVANLIPNGGLARDSVKEQIETSSSKSSPQKRSFLDRVWSRKESPGKSDKRSRAKVSASPNAQEELPSYDDVSDLNRGSSTDDRGIEELPEYNCPPPPRPFRPKSPIVSDDHGEELYDDVSAHREQCNKYRKGREMKNGATEPSADGDLSHEEIEHYQSPRSDLRVRDDAAGSQQNEELYDDIALWADFKARQRDIAERRDSSENGRPTVGSDKRSRSRFAVNRKARSANDFAETNRRSVNEGNEENEDSAESNGSAKRNTFQKLISKMENSLAKVSARSPPPLSANKTIGGTANSAS